jgi:hypothetical protein
MSKTLAEQHLEVIEEAERVAKSVAAYGVFKRLLIPLPPAEFNRLREAIAALGWRDSATREDEIGLNPNLPVRFLRCNPDMPMPTPRGIPS